MDHKNNTIKLYASQADVVIQTIEKNGVCFSKAAYVSRKYQESAPVFLTAYSWFVAHAEKIVPKPEGAEFPYWAFMDLYSLDQSGNSNLLKLNSPKTEAVFFDVRDWTRIMQLRYLGETPEEEAAFQKEMRLHGLNGNDVMLTSFYPEWKQRIVASWEKLFRHHDHIIAGDYTGVHSVQAGLWRICKDWILD